MRQLGSTVFLLAAIVGCQTLIAQQKRAFTPEDAVAIRSVYDANVSPDGKRILFVVSEPRDSSKPQLARDQNIWIVPSDGSQPARPFVSSPRRETTPRWSPDGRRLAFLSNRGEDGLTQVWLMSSDSGAAEKLTSAKTGVENFKWSPDGRMIAFLMRDNATEAEKKMLDRRDDAIEIDHDNKFLRLYTIGVDDRTPTLVTRQNVEVRDFDWSPDATSFAVAFNSRPGLAKDITCTLGVIRRADGELQKTFADDVNLLGSSNIRWSPDGKTLLFFQAAPRKSAYWMSLVDTKNGQVRPLLKEYTGTFWSCLWTPDSKQLLAGALIGTRGKLLRITVATEEMSAVADFVNSGADISASADGHTLAFVSERIDSPRDIWSVSIGQSARQLTNCNAQVASLKLGAVREVSWKSRKDGRTLYGVLVTPPDFTSGQPCPTVVEAHPGISTWLTGWHGSWYHWAQLLASNGYVVFMPNVPGVEGQGWKFGEMIRTYSGEAFDATMDGVDYLVEQRIADPNRLGIGGWSNGGYMTAWAVTHTTRFKAAVPFAAPVDIATWWATPDMSRLIEVTSGDTPLNARQEYEARSPFHFIQKCKTPMLILHGENDATVPIGQSYELYYALKALGVETEMVVYPREGHSLVERAHQIDFQRRVLAWFEKYLK